MSLKNTFFGAAVGFVVGGPMGALLGAVIGGFVPAKDSSRRKIRDTEKNEEYIKTKTSEFTYSLLILFAIIIKADKTTKRSEILFVRKYLVANFGIENAKEMMQLLKSLLEKEINSKEICEQIRINTDYYFRLELIHLLFKLAAADGTIVEEEFAEIKFIATNLSLGQLDFIRIASMFAEFNRNQRSNSQRNTTNNYISDESKLETAYKILGVPNNSDKIVVKKAYRKLSKEYHPDRVAHLGENYTKIAAEKFIKMKAAYDLISENS